MVSTFINPLVNSKANLGLGSFDDSPPTRLWPNSTGSEVDVVIRAVYRQVLGNAHVMDSERLVASESRLKQGDISVREFVRQVGQSDLYRTLFFESCPRLRSIELNFKHLLGRAPEGQADIAAHSDVLDQGGFAAEIDSYIDSDEYQSAFGEDTVPYYRGHKTQAGKNMAGFTHLFQLLRGMASSDKAPTQQNRARLNAALMANQPSVIAPVKGAPFPWQRPDTTTDFSQLIATVLGLKTGSPDQPLPSSALPYVAAVDIERQGQFYHAYQPFKETSPVELCPGFSVSDAEVVIRAVYRQVLGNAHVMESERLVVAESQLKRGELTVREFVRRLAVSELYRSRFFYTCYRYRTIELNYKHLLGRAPDNFEEMRYHSAILDQDGFAADIDTYIDSEEYQATYGENIVPYYRGYLTQPGQSMLEFTNMLQLLRSASSSDKHLIPPDRPQLTRAIIQNSPYGKLKVRDVSEILAEVFKPKDPLTVDANLAAGTEAQGRLDQALQQTIQEQREVIEQLQHQLREISPAATIGATQLKSDWRPSSSATAETIGASVPWQQQAKAQADQIAALQGQIADAQRYAAIGEFSLNKWRSRMFNG